MGSKREPYEDEISESLSDTTSEIFEFEEVESGKRLYVTFASFEDEDNAPTTIAFGRYDADRFISLEEDDSPSAGIRYHTERTHRFEAGEEPAVRVEGGTSGDKISGYIEGYLEEA